MSVADMGQLYNDSEADTRHTAHRHVYCLFFHNGAVRALTTVAVRIGVPARAETQRHSVDIVMKVGITGT